MSRRITHPWLRTLAVPILVMAGWTVTGCGDESSTPATDGSSTSAPTTASTVAPTTVPDTTESATTEPATTEPATTTVTTAVPTTVTPAMQPALWPAADVVLATPEEAAAGFIESMLGVPPVLAPFRAGDSRSGEIDAMSAAETGSTNLRATLLLRQLGHDDGWFVIGAINPMVSIDTPEAGSVVPAGPLSVAGAARGYEATIIVKAFVAGTTELVVDPAIAMGGSMETPEPYATHLDLSFATPGTVIALVVRGDTGLETDPGEFSAIPLVIGG
jgi:hypothetical protein